MNTLEKKQEVESEIIDPISLEDLKLSVNNIFLVLDEFEAMHKRMISRKNHGVSNYIRSESKRLEDNHVN